MAGANTTKPVDLSESASELVEGAAHTTAPSVENVSAHHHRRHPPVAMQSLHSTDRGKRQWLLLAPQSVPVAFERRVGAGEGAEEAASGGRREACSPPSSCGRPS